MTVWQPRLVHWLKFNAVGTIGIFVQLSVLAMLRSGFGWNYLLSTAAAVEITVIHNFLWHERFTWAEAADRHPASQIRGVQSKQRRYLIVREFDTDEVAGRIL